MAHASVEMPYFIKPSINLTKAEKKVAYEDALSALKALLHGETDHMTIMVSINCILKTHLPYFYWTGFYLMKNDRLEVGPYQGTLGCLHIEIGKGVCGAVAASGKTKIVDDTHSLTQGDEHIACDPNSLSEIVVPVFDSEDELIAVFDVDSTLKGSFDKLDQEYLEKVIREFFR